MDSPARRPEVVGGAARRYRAGMGRHPDADERPHRNLWKRVQALTRALGEEDEAAVEAAVIGLSRSRRILAPLSLTVGAVIMLLQGLQLIVRNWRLFLLEVVPGMWTWAAMLDLKAHLFRGATFREWQGAPALAMMVGIVVVTVGSYYLNAVFAFALVSPKGSAIRPAFGRARQHLVSTLLVGGVIGVALAVAAIVSPRWGREWFSVSLSVVVAVMMVTYVLFPSRLIGMSAEASRRDMLAATAVGGVAGAVICTPAYLIGRIGVLLLGSRLAVIGIILLCVGFSLHAGATGAVRAVTMSVKLMSKRPSASSRSRAE